MTRFSTLFLALAALAAAPTAAQSLPSGAWTGTLTDDDGDRHPVEAELAQCAGGFTLDLAIDGRTARVSEEAPARWQGGRFRFATDRFRLPGTLLPRVLACDLEADETATLHGLCTAGRGQYRLRLVPPVDGQMGCE